MTWGSVYAGCSLMCWSYMTETWVADCAYQKYSLCRLSGGFPVVFIVCSSFHQSKCDVFLFSRWSAKLWHWKIPSGLNTFCRCCAAFFFFFPHASCYLTLAFTATLSLPPQHRLRCVNASSREFYRRKRNLKRNPQKWHPWTENGARYVSLSATYFTCLLIKKNKKKSPQGTKGEVCVVGTGRKHSWFLCCEKSEKEKNVVPCKVLGTVAKFSLCRSTRRSQVCQVRVLCLCS